jgi:Phosphopantetheine attachment site
VLLALAILGALFVTAHNLITLFRGYRARGNPEILHCSVGQGAACSKGNRQDGRCVFNRLGLDSAMLVYLMMELEEKFGSQLSPDDF